MADAAAAAKGPAVPAVPVTGRSNLSPNLKPGYHRIELNRTIWEVPDRYSKLQTIGSGAYGQVCSAEQAVTQESEAGTTTGTMKVAIKKLTRPFQSAIHAKRTYREFRLLKQIKHENVIGLLDVFSPAVSMSEMSDVYFVTHFMGADLNQIIKTQKLSDDHVQFLVYQILRGLKYIHSAGIIHRDLKPSNLAVNEDCELKILDFGLARQAEAEMTGYVATRWYRAPEIMLNWMHYNQTVDVWSVGCIMAELMTGKTLFPGTDHIDQLHKIMTVCGTPDQEFMAKITSEDARNYLKTVPVMKRKNLKDVLMSKMQSSSSDYHHHHHHHGHHSQATAAASSAAAPASAPQLNPDAVDLLTKMLELDADRRPTATQALAHPYLAQYADPTDEPVSDTLFDDSFEDKEMDVKEWKKLIWDELESWNVSQATPC